MKFTEGELAELKRIYFEEFREKISDKEAVEIAMRFVEFCRAVLRALPVSRVAAPLDEEEEKAFIDSL